MLFKDFSNFELSAKLFHDFSNFGKGYYGEHLCEIISNSGQCFRGQTLKKKDITKLLSSAVVIGTIMD